MDKRGAIEMSMTTVVVIVLAMTMLILGLTLVRTIFSGAQYNVKSINDKVRGEINKLFVDEEQRSAIYLPSNTATVKQGESFGLAFAIRNVGAEGAFTYATKKVSTNCVRDDPMKWFDLPPATSTAVRIGDGGVDSPMLSLKPSSTSELCKTEFIIEIKKDGAIYDTPHFWIEIAGKGII